MPLSYPQLAQGQYILCRAALPSESARSHSKKVAKNTEGRVEAKREREREREIEIEREREE